MNKTKDETVWVKLAKLPLPKESWGRCKNARSKNASRVRRSQLPEKVCPTTPTVLGDGYCVRCWDIGFPRNRDPIRKTTPRVKR